MEIIFYSGRSLREWVSAWSTFQKGGSQCFWRDISENMIASARERYPACTFVASPCTPLGFENESMDVITVFCAFDYFETPQNFANECMRVLKKNGKVLIAEPFFFSGGAVACQYSSISIFLNR